METRTPIKKTRLSRTSLPRPPRRWGRCGRPPSTRPRRTSPAPPSQVTRGGLFWRLAWHCSQLSSMINTKEEVDNLVFHLVAIYWIILHLFQYGFPTPRGLKASHESWSIVINQLKLHINGQPITKLVPNLYRHLQTSIVYNTASICLFLTSTFPIHTLYIYMQLIILWSYTHVWSIFLYLLNTLYIYEYWIHNISYPWLYIIHHAELLFYACTHDMPPLSRPVYICSKLCFITK